MKKRRWMALVVASIVSGGLILPTNANPLQKPFFAKVAQISGGIVRPLKDENSRVYRDQNSIFEVDLEGNGSSYIVSYGKMTRIVKSAPAKVEISFVMADGRRRPRLNKGELVLLALNAKDGGKLTILPFSSASQDVSVELRPLRRKGKDRHIPYSAQGCAGSIPQDRDAISWGDSGFADLVYYKNGWKLLSCDDGQ